MKTSLKCNVFCFKGTPGRAGAKRERGRGTRKRGNTKRGGIFKGERKAIYAFDMSSTVGLIGAAREL